MKLVLQQRACSYFDSYDVVDENNELAFHIRGEYSWGHILKIYDQDDVELGYIKERMKGLSPMFEFYEKGGLIGQIQKEVTLWIPEFHLSFKDFVVTGDIWEYNYVIANAQSEILRVREQFAFRDTYELTITKREDALYCMMIVLAIDALKCNKN